MPCGSTTSWGSGSAPASGFSGGPAAPASGFTTCADPATTWGSCCDCAAPTLTSVSPATGAQAATVSVTLVGTGFTAASAIAVSGTGVTIQNVVVVGATQITADFVLATLATISTRAVTVTTENGVSNTQNFAVTSGIAAIANRELWLDATDNTTLTIATGVSAWADVTGNGRSVVQATGNKQPSVQAALIGGLQALRFDGVNDAMTIAWPAAAQLNAGSTIFIVAVPRFANDTAYRPLIRTSPSNAVAVQHNSSTDSGNIGSRSRLVIFAVTNTGTQYAIPAAVTTQVARLITARFAPTEPTINLYKNGTLDGGPTAGFATLTTTVGDTFSLCVDDFANFGTYDIGEIIIFSRALTVTERQLVETILLAKWSLP